MGNYYSQIKDNYPDRAKIVEWLKYALDARVYYYGQNFKYPYENPSLLVKIRLKIIKFLYRFKSVKVDYNRAVISNAYFNVGGQLKKNGFNVVLPPWTTNNMSRASMRTIDEISNSNFNYILSDAFFQKIENLVNDVRAFLSMNKVRFVLLSNDMVPIHRITLDVCKDLGIPTGIFLHGLPGRYNSIDDSRANYLFVWGDRIKENYLRYGCKSTVVVTGHPNYSAFNLVKINSLNVLVLTKASVGTPSRSDKYKIDDRGLSIQYVYAVEKVLKNLNYKNATLRLHPSESPQWYKKFIDTDFFTIDDEPLKNSLSHAKMVIGPVSTVMLDAVFNDIPYYPYIISTDNNSYAGDMVPPFNDFGSFPTSLSCDDLEDRIKKCDYVKKEHLNGYINPVFNIDKISNIINKKNG